MAARQGLRLVKSRLRDPHATGFGRYMLLNSAGHFVHPGMTGPTEQPAWTLDQIEDFLATPPGNR